MCITEQQDDWMTMKRAVPAHWGRILNYCRRIDEIRIESPGSCDRDNASHCQAVSFSLAQSKLTKKQEATSSASELVKMGATDWQCQKKTETDPATAIRTNLNADSKPFFPRNMTATNPSQGRSEEHTSELQSRPHISYAVFCLKKKKNKQTKIGITLAMIIYK